MNTNNSYKDSHSLSEWLKVHWFYPEDFKKKKLIESSKRSLVVGEHLSYEFLKQPSFEQKLELLLREIKLNADLAPDVFLGLKLVKWIDEVPCWINASSLLSRTNIKQDEVCQANEVALVLRNIPSSSILSEQLRDIGGSNIGSAVIPRLVNVLKDFYSKRTRQGIKIFSNEPRSITSKIIDRLTNKIPQYSLNENKGIFFNTLFPYLISQTKKHLLASDSFIRSRGAKGKLKLIHGNLKLDNICTKPIFEGGKNINIIGRELEVYGDELEDIAQLFTEFLSNDNKKNALELKGLFVKRDEESFFDLIVALFCINKISKNHPNTNVGALLSNAFLSLHSKSKPIVIHLDSSLESFKNIFSSYLNCEIILEKESHDFLLDSFVIRDQSFLKLKSKVKKRVSAKKNMIIYSTYSSSVQVLELEKSIINAGGLFVNIKDKKKTKLRNSTSPNDIYKLGNCPLNTWVLSDALSIEEKWLYTLNILLDALEPEG